MIVIMLKEAFVVIVHGDREHFFGMILTDDVCVEVPLERLGFWQPQIPDHCQFVPPRFLLQNILAGRDAGIANVHPRTSNQFSNF
jgi:hypothetical protein